MAAREAALKREAQLKQEQQQPKPATRPSTQTEAPFAAAPEVPAFGGGSGGGGGGAYDPRTQAATPSSRPWLASLALILAALGLAFGGWQWQRAQVQQQSLSSLADRIQELEIRLSETGQDLSEAGSSFSQRLKDHTEKLEWADSEIRKLWVVAHQRNRPAIAEIQEQLKGMETRLSEAATAASRARTAAGEATTQTQRLATRLEAETQEAKQALAKLTQEVSSYSNRLAEVSLTSSTLRQQLRDQDRRNQVSELQDQMGRLQEQLAEQAGMDLPDNLAERLAEQEEILASLEASRSQLVSRVTRLMDDVRELQQGR